MGRRFACRFARVARFASQARSARFPKQGLNYPVNNPPTPTAVERVGTNSKLIVKHSGDPRGPDLGGRGSLHQLLRHPGSRNHRNHAKMMDFDANGTPEALDERNQYSGTSGSHWEGSRTLERGPGPQKLITGPRNWGRWHGEAFK